MSTTNGNSKVNGNGLHLDGPGAAYVRVSTAKSAEHRGQK